MYNSAIGLLPTVPTWSVATGEDALAVVDVKRKAVVASGGAP